MIPSTSRPTFAPLAYKPARHQLFVADPIGLPVLLAFADGLPEDARAAGEFYGVATTAPALPAPWRAQGFSEEATLLAALPSRIALLGMGTRLSIAGRESFILRVGAIAEAAGIAPSAIGMACAESTVRRVQCAHCKSITDGATGRLVPCTGCGRMLLVRDHFSRRLAAFQGVLAASAPDLAAQYRGHDGWT